MDTPGETPDQRRQLVLTAALREFAERGYEAASTNAITEAAGISKGLLFHYFGSKQGLYLAVLRHCVAHSAEWSARARQEAPPVGDFLERLLQNGLRKLKYTVEYPLEAKLVVDAFVAPPPGLKGEIEAMGESYRPLVTEMFTKDLDPGIFRDGVSMAKAVEIVMLFLEGLRSRYAKPELLEPRTFERAFAETREFFEILKYGIYKPKT